MVGFLSWLLGIPDNSTLRPAVPEVWTRILRQTAVHAVHGDALYSTGRNWVVSKSTNRCDSASLL